MFTPNLVQFFQVSFDGECTDIVIRKNVAKKVESERLRVIIQNDKKRDGC